MAESILPKEFSHLESISPIDGRFRGNVQECSQYFSEMATEKFRVEVEIKYLIAIANLLQKKKIPTTDEKLMLDIIKDFSLDDASWIEKKDLEINHDTKSVEYFIQEKLKQKNIEKYLSYIHFGLTSADSDNNGVVLSVKRFEEEILSKKRKEILNSLRNFIESNKISIFIGRTHGKIAMPTSMSKEFANFYMRLKKIDKDILSHKFEGKITGALGNWNALSVSYPEINWVKFSKEFVSSLDLIPNMFTTQILPYDNLIKYYNFNYQFNSVLISLCRDIWAYISYGYLKLKVIKEEVGSSTMPHKVNPISYEGCESNLLLANSQFENYARLLSSNRLQRDLTDKYISRGFGVPFAESLLGYKMLLGGLNIIYFDTDFANSEMELHWEVLTEAVQTILRKRKYLFAYEKTKDLTRGKTLNNTEYIDMINSLEGIDDETKNLLMGLNPKEYIGWAQTIVEEIK